MTAKKFPTPHLDAFSCFAESRSMNEAVQADIALAVESARTVPAKAIEILLPLVEKATKRRKAEYLSRKSTHKPTPGERASLANDMAELISIKEWLESLTVAPKESPTQDNWCGTCGWCGPAEEDPCEAPVPLSVKDQKKTIFAYGDTCPCWKEKP
jgi:hypothetical protein